MTDKKKSGTAYRMKYAGNQGKGVVVTLPFDPHKRICEACGKSVARGEIKFTAFHHWWYAYAPKTVKDNPILVLDNTSELCFYCHEVGDAIRALLYTKPERVAMVAECLKGEQKERFIKVLIAIINVMKKNSNGKSDMAAKLMEMIRNGK